MTGISASLQPGPVFYEVFLGSLRIFGTNIKEWAADHEVDASNVRMAATGAWNGPKARALRDAMVESIGEETFRNLYAQRMAQEERGAA